MTSFRHLSRELVLRALFFYFFQDNQQETDIKDKAFSYIIDEFGKELPETEFADNLYNGVVTHIESFYSIILEYAPEWPLDKVALVDKLILCIGLFELIHSQKDVPAVVAINEAVELAKSYGDLNSSKFINGVLHNYAKDNLQEKLVNKENV